MNKIILDLGCGKVKKEGTIKRRHNRNRQN